MRSKIYNVPLNPEEIRSCIVDGEIFAVIKVPFMEVVEVSGPDELSDLIQTYFPGFTIFSLTYRLVGCEPKIKCYDSSNDGFLYIEVEGEGDPYRERDIARSKVVEFMTPDSSNVGS